MKRDILGQHSSPSAQEIKYYLKNKLSDQEEHAIELKIQGNEFSFDAMEGYEEMNLVPNTWTSINSTVFWVSSISMIVLILSASFWLLKPENTQVNLTKPQSSEVVLLNPIEEIKKPLVSEATVLSPPKIWSPKAATVSEKPLENDLLEFKQLIIPLNSKSKIIRTKKLQDELKIMNSKIRHYKNYKLVLPDNSFNQNILPPVLSHTPPFSETEIKVLEDSRPWISADSIYTQKINQSIDYITSSNFSAAITTLKGLFEKYPNDLTTQFYLGYAHFLKQNFKACIPYFKRAITHHKQTFDQDARFFVIQAHTELGQPELAEKDLNYLISTNSAYLREIETRIN